MENTARKQTQKQISRIVGLGVLTAVVIVLQMFASTIHFGPFSISLCNVPIAIGAVLYGIPGGIWLGFAFGAVVLISGDANLFFAVNILGTIVTVMAKGIAAGAVSAVMNRLITRKNRTVAAIVAAFSCPVVNTGVFLLGCLCFFLDTVRGWGQAVGMADVGRYMIFGLVGVNFLMELAVSVVLTPVVVMLLRAARRNNDTLRNA